jgi:hypothetical protein
LFAVALALVSSLLVYRIVSLDQRIDVLSKKVAQATGSTGSSGSDPKAKALGLERRVATLEAKVQALQTDLRELEQADLAPSALQGAANKPADDQILSVVGRVQDRIRDRQLQFHRARWLKWRASALDGFAEQLGLSSWQTEQLHQLLSDEVDGMIEIMRRPEALENPEQAASEWQARLDQTDTAARRVLEPSQLSAWEQARAAERQTLWPWLPAK